MRYVLLTGQDIYDEPNNPSFGGVNRYGHCTEIYINDFRWKTTCKLLIPGNSPRVPGTLVLFKSK